MAVLEIRTFNDSVLTKPAKGIRKVTDELRQLALDMAETMAAANGVGLAANQVGISKRLIVVAFEDGPRAFINPRILKKSSEKILADEGCLSFPMLYGEVARHAEVRVAVFDLEMQQHKFEAEGLLARIFQHEIDHLNGITFTQRAEKGTLREVRPDEGENETEAGAEASDGAARETDAASAGGGAAE